VLDRGWELGIGLTALPLRCGRRPVAAHASASHGVGLVSIPSLGAVHRGERLHDGAVQIVEGLLGEAAGEDGGAGRGVRMARRGAELAVLIEIESDEPFATRRTVRAPVAARWRPRSPMRRGDPRASLDLPGSCGSGSCPPARTA
jgi:hypothetical protein